MHCSLRLGEGKRSRGTINETDQLKASARSVGWGSDFSTTRHIDYECRTAAPPARREIRGEGGAAGVRGAAMISRVYRPRHVTRKCSETAGTAFKAGEGAARARPPVIKTRGKLNISFRSTRATAAGEGEVVGRGGWGGGIVAPGLNRRSYRVRDGIRESHAAGPAA